jgi:hypothetical protein
VKTGDPATLHVIRARTNFQRLLPLSPRVRKPPISHPVSSTSKRSPHLYQSRNPLPATRVAILRPFCARLRPVCSPCPICQLAINNDCRKGATPAAFISLIYHEACTTTPLHDNVIAARCARIQTYPRLSFPCNCAFPQPRSTATDRVHDLRSLHQLAHPQDIGQSPLQSPWRPFNPTRTWPGKGRFLPTCPRKTSSVSSLYVVLSEVAPTRHANVPVCKTY